MQCDQKFNYPLLMAPVSGRKIGNASSGSLGEHMFIANLFLSNFLKIVIVL
jgi:hypothetical protein